MCFGLAEPAFTFVEKMNMIKLQITLDGIERILIVDDLIEASVRLGFVPTDSLNILRRDMKKKFPDSSIRILKRNLNSNDQVVM